MDSEGRPREIDGDCMCEEMGGFCRVHGRIHPDDPIVIDP